MKAASQFYGTGPKAGFVGLGGKAAIKKLLVISFYLVISVYKDKPKGKRMQLSIFFDDHPAFFDEWRHILNGG